MKWIIDKDGNLLNLKKVSRIYSQKLTYDETEVWVIRATLCDDYEYNYVIIGTAATEQEAKKLMRDALKNYIVADLSAAG